MKGKDVHKQILPNSGKLIVAFDLEEGVLFKIPDAGLEISMIHKQGKKVRIVIRSDKHVLNIARAKIIDA